MSRLLIAPIAAIALLAACNGDADETDTPPNAADLPLTDVPAATATIEPVPSVNVTVPSIPPASEIQVPEGFTAYLIADDLSLPTAVTVGPDGTLYAALRHDGVMQLSDIAGDGFFEQRTQFLPDPSAYNENTGLVVSGANEVYIGDRGRISVATDEDGDGVADSVTPIITGLTVGLHQNDGLEFGPDGRLYIAGGSTCDDCEETAPLAASILRVNPDGSGLESYASGIRNTYDLAFDTQGRLWGTDNGSDGQTAPFCATIDELNLIEQGTDYGWPYAPECDPYSNGTRPVVSLGLHTAATGIDDYSGSHFPTEYQGDLFFTLWGSYVFAPEFDPELYRYTPGDDAIQAFSTGFVSPIDVHMDLDGTLLVADYGLGALYRILNTG